MTPRHEDSTTQTRSTERIDSVEYVDSNNRDLERVGGGGVDLDSASSRNPGVSDTEPGRGLGTSIGSRNPGVSDTEPGRGQGTSIECGAGKELVEPALSDVHCSSSSSSSSPVRPENESAAL